MRKRKSFYSNWKKIRKRWKTRTYFYSYILYLALLLFLPFSYFFHLGLSSSLGHLSISFICNVIKGQVHGFFLMGTAGRRKSRWLEDLVLYSSSHMLLFFSIMVLYCLLSRFIGIFLLFGLFYLLLGIFYSYLLVILWREDLIFISQILLFTSEILSLVYCQL